MADIINGIYLLLDGTSSEVISLIKNGEIAWDRTISSLIYKDVSGGLHTFSSTNDHNMLSNIGIHTHVQIDGHIDSTSNPHNVTKAQLGLGNVDNTSDINKPISSATQTALSAKQNSLGFTPENINNKGAVNGYASLGADGKVPAGQLPSYVDDILEFTNYVSLPLTGETGKIYVTLDDNKTYRWTGTVYVQISSGNIIFPQSQIVFGTDTGTNTSDKYKLETWPILGGSKTAFAISIDNAVAGTGAGFFALNDVANGHIYAGIAMASGGSGAAYLIDHSIATGFSHIFDGAISSTKGINIGSGYTFNINGTPHTHDASTLVNPIVIPLNQLVVGNNTGITSSSALTFNSATGRLNVDNIISASTISSGYSTPNSGTLISSSISFEVDSLLVARFGILGSNIPVGTTYNINGVPHTHSQYITANQNISLTGDATGSGTTNITMTLATVNSSVGSYGSSSVVPIVTVNAKGLVTSVSTATITPTSIGAESSLGLPAQVGYFLTSTVGGVRSWSAVPAGSLNGLTDVLLSTPVANQLLQYNGTRWINWTPTYISANQNISVTGDATGSGTTAISLTLATVNSNVGIFGSSSVVPVITVNAKGLITSVTTSTITPSAIGAIPSSEKGANSGVATLDTGGKIPLTQLPSGLGFTPSAAMRLAFGNSTATSLTDSDNLKWDETNKKLFIGGSAGGLLFTIDNSLSSGSLVFTKTGAGLDAQYEFKGDYNSQSNQYVPIKARSVDITGTYNINGVPHTHSQLDVSSASGWITTALSGKEPTITSGTASQFWKGNKTWATLSTEDIPDIGVTYVKWANVGAANGVASLGATSLVPTAQLGTGTANSTTYLRGDGTWATNITYGTSDPGSAAGLSDGTLYFKYTP